MTPPISNTRFRLLYNKANAWYLKSNYTRALTVLQRIEKEIVAYPEDLLLLKDLTNLKGHIYYSKAKFQQAENYYLRSLEYCKQIGEPRFIYNRYDNLAAVCISTNRPHSAIGYLQKAIELKESSGNECDLGRGYIQLSGLLFGIENLGGGKTALDKAGYYLRKYKQKDFFHHLHFAQGMQLKREKKYEAAIKEYNTAIRLALKKGDKSVALKALHNKGDIYIEQGNWSAAEKPLNEAVKIARQTNALSHELRTLVNLAVVFFEKKNYERCKELLKYIRQHEAEDNNETLVRDSALLHSRLYSAEGKHAEALKEYEKYMEVYKRIYNTELSHSVLDLQAKYESEKRERELQESKLQQIESELKALRAQIDPHFIFNALNSIRKEALEGNAEKVDQYLVRFSRLLRLILNSTRNPRISLTEIMELLHLYIQIEQTRQDNRFGYRIQVHKAIDAARVCIPGLILQPLVENAIIHGLYNKKNGKGQLNIGFSKKGNALQVIISDNGIGRKKSAGIKKAGHQSHALDIIRETLQLTWKGKEAANSLLIKDKQHKNGKPAGTQVTVLLPLS